MDGTKIEWAHKTFNPWVGCAKVSPACEHCYAEAQQALWLKNVVWGLKGTRKKNSDAYWEQPRRWAKRKTRWRQRVFCASLADVFEDREDLKPWRGDLWNLIRDTPQLDWLLLTKRPEKISSMLPTDWGKGWSHVWLGTSLEMEVYTHRRLTALLSVPAVVHFLSCEPLLGALNLSPWLGADKVNWLICGGETGRKARVMDASWARALRDQCVEKSVPYFFKQWGVFDEFGKKVGKEKSGRLLDEKQWDEVPRLRSVHGRAAVARFYEGKSRVPISRETDALLASAAANAGKSKGIYLDDFLSRNLPKPTPEKSDK